MAHYQLGEHTLALEELKHHLNIDHDEDDTYLACLAKVAMQRTFAMTNRPVEELLEIGGGTYPDALRLAAMQLTAHWYRVRESVSSVNQVAVPFGLALLVKPFVKLATDD